MATNNSLQRQPQKTGITAFLNSVAVCANIDQALGKDNRQRFITGIISAVNTNSALATCTNQSILTAALLGETLKLSPSPQLAHYYMVPFTNKKEKTTTAQFVLGYKGMIQLAVRSGQYKKINVVAVKQGELVRFDPLNEEIEINMNLDNWDEREQLPTIGYYAMFELVNGFRKAMYWSKDQMLAHADKYSAAFSKDAYPRLQNGEIPANDLWKFSSFWYKDFDGMAFKTMLRQLISKWGIMSIDMQSAIENDNTVGTVAGAPREVVEYQDEVVEVVSEQPEPAQEAQKATYSQPTQAQKQSAADALFN